MKHWNSYGLLSTLAFACLMHAIMPALAQGAAKPTFDKWRPKDGFYGFANNTAFSVPCENFPLQHFELSKRLLAAEEFYECKITKITDAALDVLRLSLSCYDNTDGKSKSVMTLRKIDEKSFFVSWRGLEKRFTFCEENFAPRKAK